MGAWSRKARTKGVVRTMWAIGVEGADDDVVGLGVDSGVCAVEGKDGGIGIGAGGLAVAIAQNGQFGDEIWLVIDGFNKQRVW